MSAGKRFDITSPEGKSRASAFLFPYIEALESDIQRESTIQHLSAAFGIREQALLSDYRNRKQPRPVMQSGQIADKPVKARNVKRNAELRAVLAVVANPAFFPLMRSSLTSDDFEDSFARDLYIVLEECYRTDATSVESLLERCPDEETRRIVTETLTGGEFAENAQKTVEDSIQLVRKNVLEKKRDRLVARLASYNFV